MKKPIWAVLGIVLAFSFLYFGRGATASPLSAQSQEKLTVEPDPSYSESAVSSRRHPEVDTDVFLYINHWRNSAPYEGWGGLILRDILTPGDPAKPAKKGAVLKYIKAYARGVLQPNHNTVPTKSASEQVFFYVTAGTGRVESGAKRAALDEGTAVFVPAGVEYRFLNPAEHPLEMIVVVEEIGPGFVPNREISVGSYHNSVPSTGVHWAHIGHGIAYDVPPKFYNPMGFSAVSIDSFDIAQPHCHGPGTEEIWCQVKGKSLLLFGNRLLTHEPGEAFLVPPNNKVPHSSINPTGEQMLWLYMGNRHDQVKK
jgi:mannose-6-phosphate isomerase-like protein (cupin superfamily)